MRAEPQDLKSNQPLQNSGEQKQIISKNYGLGLRKLVQESAEIRAQQRDGNKFLEGQQKLDRTNLDSKMLSVPAF